MDKLPELVSQRRENDHLPLSFGQERLWFYEHLNPGKSVYNESGIVQFKGPLSVKTLEETLNEIIRRHEALRTRFTSTRSSPSMRTSRPPSMGGSWITRPMWTSHGASHPLRMSGTNSRLNWKLRWELFMGFHGHLWR